MYNSKYIKSNFSIRALAQSSLDILSYFFKFDSDFKYFIHVGRILKGELSEVIIFLTHKHILILSIKLTAPNIFFIFHNFILEID